MTKEQALNILQQTTASYNTVAQDFATTRVFAWPEAELFLPYLKSDGRRLVVADIGCGNGRMVSWVKKLDADYIGVDSSEKLLAIAQQHFPQDKFSLGDLLHLPLADASVDIVLLNASLHHIPKPLLAQALGELRRVLKPHGYALMVNWSLWQTRFIYAHFLEWGQQLAGRSPLCWQDFWVSYSSPDKKTRVNRFYHGFTRRELSKLAAAHGFQVRLQGYVYKSDFVSVFNGRNLLSVWKKNKE